MSVFIYKALDAGAEVGGTIAADTPMDARELLRGRGLIVRNIAESGSAADTRKGKSMSGMFRFGARRVTRHEVTTFVREASTLLGVGVPLLEALETIARQHAGRFHTAIVRLRDRVSSGVSLAAAMREQPAVFDDLCVNITEVGEDAGTLDASLERLADFRERSEQIKGRIGTALIYPAIVMVVAIFCSVFLMTFVVPKIIEPLAEQGMPLPWPTRVVKGMSDFLLSWGWLAGIGAAAVVAAASAALRSEPGRRRWHRMVLKLPLVGELVRKQTIVQIAVVLATLLKSGVVFVRALQIAQRTVANRVFRSALGRCEAAIVAGGDIADSLEQSRAFPPMVVQVFALGQQTGRLEEMLDRLASAYDREVSSAATRLAAVVEPVLIVILALVVLLIVMSTVLPILEAGNAIQ